ncbi:unnamed protein product, partial [Rangifer tarandus platyrhynchus]
KRRNSFSRELTVYDGEPFCKCPSPQTLLGISQKVSHFTLVPKMRLICIIILFLGTQADAKAQMNTAANTSLNTLEQQYVL